jgi:acetylornithine deacetylase
MPTTIEILEKLIAFETISRRSNVDLIDYLRHLLATKAVSCQMIANDSGSNINLFATIGPPERPGVVLSGHTDVVPVEGQNWTRDPFRLTQQDGRLYGRGTADMKGFLACAVQAALKAAERDLKTPIHLALSYDEEIGCVGVRRMLDRLVDLPARPLFCIVGEPTELAVATGHKGKVALRATCHGKEVHSALAPSGVNAIYLASEFIQALRDKQARIEASGSHDNDYEVPFTTIHAGVITGGTALNIVPNLCHVDFEIRNVEEDDPAEFLAQLEEATAEILNGYPPEARIEIEVTNSYPGLDTPADAEVVAFAKALTGANSTTKVAFGTEAGLFNDRLGVPSVVCGPGSMAQGHKPDEFIARSQLENCEAMLDRLIDRLSD